MWSACYSMKTNLWILFVDTTYIQLSEMIGQYIQTITYASHSDNLLKTLPDYS